MRTLALASLALIVTGCSGNAGDADQSDDTSGITAGQIVAGDAPYYWANLTFDQHQAALAAVGSPPTDPSNFAPDDDPLAVRLQAIADRLDWAMRAVTHNTSAPHPVVKLLKTSKTFNAWSSGTFARLGAPVGDPAHPLPDGNLLYFGDNEENHHTEIGAYAGSLDPFVHPDAWQRPASFTQVWNMNPATDPTCRLKVVSGRILPTSDACAVLGQSANDALVPTTSPFLTIATDLVESFQDETTMVLVMAHELGHLYRAHSSPLTTRKYGFWYDQGPSAKRPVPSEKSAELASIYQQFERTPIGTDTIKDVKLPVEIRLLPLLAAYYTELMTTAYPTLPHLGLTDCVGYPEWASKYGSPKQLVINAVQSQSADTTLEEAYRALEPIFSACGAVHFAEKSEYSAIDYTVLDKAIAGSLIAPLPVKPTDQETVVAYLARAVPSVLDLEARAEVFRADLNANHIGFYTIEQEADEVALELMVRLGYDRGAVLNAWLAFAYAMDAKGAEPELDTGRASAKTCDAWMRNDFMVTNADGSKSPVVMTVGDISEPHHGTCYRLYNLYRESKAHRYGAKGDPLPPLQPEWSTFVNHAAELTAGAKATGQ